MFNTLRAVFGLLALCLNTLIHGVLLLVLAIPKLLTPEGPARHRVRRWLTGVAESWIGVNNALFSLASKTRWEQHLPEYLNRDGCYLVLCNHQSWVDIPVLQKCFNRRLPLLRFFLKKQLIWVPVLGPCWWALDFPFMHRASREELARKPELRGRDLESARRACEIFQDVPVAMMSFPEGTRRQGSKREPSTDYERLLLPKAGGVGQVIQALGSELHGCVDVTIRYGAADEDLEPPGMWTLLRGEIDLISIDAQLRPIPSALLNRDFGSDKEAREALQEWLRGLWQEKDQLLGDQTTEGS